MGHLFSALTNADVEILLEAMGDWEAISNQEYHVMNMVKSVVMPPDDHESYAYVNDLKNYFKQREKEIRDSRSLRQEQAILLKAKLMLIKRDLNIDKLFDNAAASVASSSEDDREPNQMVVEAQNKLRLAEEFIQDLGVGTHYEQFLSERQSTT